MRNESGGQPYPQQIEVRPARTRKEGRVKYNSDEDRVDYTEAGSNENQEPHKGNPAPIGTKYACDAPYQSIPGQMRRA